MTLGPLRLQPTWWGALLAFIGCAGGIALGQWQDGRAAEKRAAAAAQVPLQVRGTLLSQHTLFLQNRPHQGKLGYYVVQPLRQANGRHVLVLRGWTAVAALPRPYEGEVILEGVQRPALPRAYEAGLDPGAGNVRQNVTIGEYAAWTGLRLEPYVIEQRSALVVTRPPAPADHLVRNWPRADSGVEKHESYAMQWYGLAGLSVVLFLVMSVRREPRRT
jgi:surfeit locus 1 family protein